MFGGTPTNISSTFLDQDRVEVVTGVNLPMVIKFAQIGEGQTLAAVAQVVKEQGQSSIYIASDLLSPDPRA
ncbi:PTS system fructose IIA component [compost metagenome]